MLAMMILRLVGVSVGAFSCKNNKKLHNTSEAKSWTMLMNSQDTERTAGLVQDILEGGMA